MIYALDHLDGSVMPLETTLDSCGRCQELNRGEIDPKVDLTLGRRLAFHREYACETITHLHYPNALAWGNGAVRMQSGAIQTSERSGDMRAVQPDPIFKDTELWSTEQRGFFRSVPRRLTPCCKLVIPEGFLECRQCRVVFSFHGNGLSPAAAILLQRAQREAGTTAESVDKHVIPGRPGSDVGITMATGGGKAAERAARYTVFTSTQMRSTESQWVKRMFRTLKWRREWEEWEQAARSPSDAEVLLDRQTKGTTPFSRD